jgi:hypothetical protein
VDTGVFGRIYTEKNKGWRAVTRPHPVYVIVYSQALFSSAFSSHERVTCTVFHPRREGKARKNGNCREALKTIEGELEKREDAARRSNMEETDGRFGFWWMFLF